jgi:hypothetical protein
MLDSPHTLAPMLMRGNALVLKTPVENAPRTSIEKHLSWSPDIPPAAHFQLQLVEIHFVRVYTPCIYARYTVVSDLEDSDNGDPLYGIILCHEL